MDNLGRTIILFIKHKMKIIFPKNIKYNGTKTLFSHMRVACITCYLCGFSIAEDNETKVWSVGRDMIFMGLILFGYRP